MSVENLLEAWQEFIVGKRSRADVQAFERDLMANLFDLHERLRTMTYRHGPYEAFTLFDPKTRNIHKASVADRILHRAVYRKLYPFFDRLFIADSFSCRIGKGTHKALDRFRTFVAQASRNHTRTAWTLKCDIRKFFASVDHDILLAMLKERIEDRDIVALLAKVVGSFRSRGPTSAGGWTSAAAGLPLGNLTSQLLANVYLNKFDQFAKHFLGARHYVRYADDFVVISHDRRYLEAILPLIGQFLRQRLRLELHPDKVFIKTIASGVDFLGWVHFPDHRVLRTATKRRMYRRIREHPADPALQSYLGLLGYGNTVKMRTRLLNDRRLWQGEAL